MKQLIWYNPDLDTYEQGDSGMFASKSAESQNEDRFVVLYEFSATSERIINKVLTSLNSARNAQAQRRNS